MNCEIVSIRKIHENIYMATGSRCFFFIIVIHICIESIYSYPTIFIIFFFLEMNEMKNKTTAVQTQFGIKPEQT